MTAAELRAWRAIHRLSRRELAEALDMSESRLVDYERGESRARGRSGAIPRVVELALAELGRRLAPAAE